MASAPGDHSIQMSRKIDVCCPLCLEATARVAPWSFCTGQALLTAHSALRGMGSLVTSLPQDLTLLRDCPAASLEKLTQPCPLRRPPTLAGSATGQLGAKVERQMAAGVVGALPGWAWKRVWGRAGSEGSEAPPPGPLHPCPCGSPVAWLSLTS